MKVWDMFLVPVSLAVSVMSLNCILNEQAGPKEVSLGSSLALTCSVTCEGCRVRVAWEFSPNGSEIKYQKSLERFRYDQGCSNETIVFNYTLSNVQHNDSGWYYCKVTIEIPTLLQQSSKGTEVVVPEPKQDWLQSNKLLIISGTSGLILIMLIVMICVVLRRRQRQKQKDMRCPVYGNTRPVPSATRKQQSSKPGTPAATRVTSKSASCRNLTLPRHPCKEMGRKSSPKI
ncbi:unnamed protein product [Lota lota]